MKSTFSPRNARCRSISAGVALWLLVAVALPAVASAGRRVPASLTSAGESRVMFRIDLEPHTIAPGALEGTRALRVPGFIPAGEPGEPALPVRTFLVAVPPAGTVRVAARVLASETVGPLRLEPIPFPDGIRSDELGPLTTERFAMEPDVYDAFSSPPLAEAREPVWIRKQRALPVRVSPLTYDPRTGEARLATSIEVTVTFDAPRPGAAARPAPPESPLWDGAFARMFVNPGQTPGWRAPGPETAPARTPRALVQGALAKLRVYETGIHRVSAATLIGQGFPAGQDIASLHLFRRSYDDGTFAAQVRDAAFAVEEGAAGSAGVFDGDDVLVFYAVGIRDDGEVGDPVRKFSAFNVYWLGTTSGPRIAQRNNVEPGFVTADTSGVTFTATGHFETDVRFIEGTPRGVADYYYANWQSDAGPVDQAFDVGAIQPGSSLSLTARMVGGDYDAPRAIRLSVVNPLGETTLEAFQSLPNKNQLDFQRQIPAASLVEGTNTFRMARPDNSRPNVGVVLNWVEVAYPSLLRARGNRLDFDTGVLAGDTSVTVTGLTSTDVWLLDTTDPDAPERLALDADHFTPLAGGSYALSFRDNIAARKRYVVSSVDAMTEVTAADVELDTPSAIIGSAAESGVDVLVVSHADFISRMQDWVSYRRAQGYRVLMADVQDVFDEFNNGVPHARAIDRFTRHFFELGNASALLLVGDSSEDNRRVEDDSGINFVPTHSWTDFVASLSEDEAVTTDKRYVKLPGPTGSVDRYPDMMVGRFPVGSDIELQRVLAKVFLFETPRADDFWRKRMIVVADDSYSEGGSTFGGSVFCDQGATEARFESGQENFAQIIENAPPAGYDVVRFFLNDYTDAIHDQQCISQLTAVQYVRDNVTELLMGELAQGAGLVTIQSHMNRRLVAHEKLLSTEAAGAIPSAQGTDHLRMNNRGRPWVLFGLGCHFSDYALHRELSRTLFNRPNGDAFAEQLLFANNAGAVSTYGSSGFEYLGETNALMNMTGRVWFYEAPYDTTVRSTRAQWIFGQLMMIVETLVADGQPNAVERYHILGDPLLHIDAGPPAFDVTVDGRRFESGSVLSSGGAGDTVQVVAVVTDENGINDFKLTIDGQDRTGDLSIEQLLDNDLAVGRQYRLAFSHKLEPRTYDIVINAYQAPDTSGEYSMAAEFVLRVESSVTLTVNGQTVASGGTVPSTADYLIELTTPVFVPRDSLGVEIDEAPVTDAAFSHPEPDDSTTWLIRFNRTLGDGRHQLVVRGGSGFVFRFDLQVSSAVGLRHVINYPNPFVDFTSFMFENDVEISEGRIDIYTVSGKRVRRLVIPPSPPGRNSVYWDGRDQSGQSIANGIYLYVIRVTQRDRSTTLRGKLSRLE